MKSRHIFCTIFLMAFIFTTVYAVPATYSSIRCGTYLVDIGTTRYEVIKKCGYPDDVRECIVEKEDPHFRRYYQGRRPDDHNVNGHTISTGDFTPVKITVHRETFTYDRGSNRLINILTIENGTLVRIETGEYGNRAPTY